MNPKITPIRSDRTSPQPPAKRRSCSVPPPHRHDQTSNLRKKKFVSLKFFDSLNDNNTQSKRSKKSKAKRISVSQPKSPTALASDGSVSIEVDKTIEIGNDLGFNMTGLGEDHKKSWVKRLCVENNVHFLGTWQSLSVPCLMVVVYAPQSQAKKNKLWHDLASLINSHDNLSVVMGDFNEVRSPSERIGSIFNQIGASKFNKFIANASLVDLQIGGKRFTRINKFGSKLSKLDHILVLNHFVNNWPHANILALTRELSDHSPLLLINRLVDYGPTLFKFYNLWLLHKDFHLLVTSCRAFTTNGYNLKSVSFKKRLQSLKNSIKSWRQTTKIEESSTATTLHNRLDYIDLKAESAPLTPSDIAFRTANVNELSCLEF
ncbi:cytochrome P450 [Tanacetum coccineum]